MSAFQIIYPYALAGSSVGLGWVLYHSLDSPFGLVLLAMGVSIVATILWGPANRFTTAIRTD